MILLRPGPGLNLITGGGPSTQNIFSGSQRIDCVESVRAKAK